MNAVMAGLHAAVAVMCVYLGVTATEPWVSLVWGFAGGANVLAAITWAGADR